MSPKLDLDDEKIREEYKTIPSIRLLAKKHNCHASTIRQHLKKIGVKLNFKKGTTINYKPNKGSFKKGNIPWGKGIKMNKEFREKCRKRMLKEFDNGRLSPSIDPIVAKKISEGKKGNKNPMWKGGITKENLRLRALLINNSWRKDILKRDNYICQDCNNSNYKLKAHHIKKVEKYPEIASDINNGITLCENCHYKSYGKEEELEEYYKNILSGFKIITITSTRPCLLRQSLIIKKLDKYFGKNHIHIYTGQNYDKNLYDIFLKDLGLRKPDYEFNLEKHLSNTRFISDCMINIEKVLKDFHPNHTLINILGDVNGAFASAYIAKRIGFKIIHNESGNRAGRDILEEINRKNIDTMSNKLLCYTQRSRENLLREGYHPKDIIVCGNPLIEVLQKQISMLGHPIRNDKYVLVTIHRNETINNFQRLDNITKALKELAKDYKIVISNHPSLAEQIKRYKNVRKMFEHPNIELHNPFNYSDFINLMKYSVVVLSDSGGECEEAAILDIPCLVLRTETERNELFEQSQMILCGTDTKNILSAFEIAKDMECFGIPEEYKKPTSSIVTKLLMRWREND